MLEDLSHAPASDLAHRIRRGAVSPVTVVEATFDRIELHPLGLMHLLDRVGSQLPKRG